jgi:hypothetical protein
MLNEIGLRGSQGALVLAGERNREISPIAEHGGCVNLGVDLHAKFRSSSFFALSQILPLYHLPKIYPFRGLDGGSSDT